jgi:hypothetical protein
VSQNDFKPFDNKAAGEYVRAVMNSYNDKRNQSGKEIQVAEIDGKVQFSSTKMDKATFDREISTMQALRKKAMDTYIEANLYTKVSDTSIMPDHKRIAHMYIPRMRYAAEALVRASPSRDPRDVINTVLSFLQTIPYDILEDRTTSNGAGYVTPINLLTNNRGDCDSKAVAMAAILRNLYPRLRIVMVYIPGHAFIGLNMPPQADDVALQIGNVRFVLAEPVGPSLMPVGKIAPDSYADLKKHQFSYQEVPF